jgi:hypothetical protein
MGFFGNLLGQAVGGGLGGLFGHRDLGAKGGGALGNLLPFSRGGIIVGPGGLQMVPTGRPTMPNMNRAPFSKGGQILGGNPGGMPRYPFRRGGQIRVIGIPDITRMKKRKCKSCKRK